MIAPWPEYKIEREKLIRSMNIIYQQIDGEITKHDFNGFSQEFALH